MVGDGEEEYGEEIGVGDSLLGEVCWHRGASESLVFHFV